MFVGKNGGTKPWGWGGENLLLNALTRAAGGTGGYTELDRGVFKFCFWTSIEFDLLLLLLLLRRILAALPKIFFGVYTKAWSDSGLGISSCILFLFGSSAICLLRTLKKIFPTTFASWYRSITIYYEVD